MRFDRRRSSSYRCLQLNEKILVGVEITTQYLGSAILSQAGGSDDEITRVIYDIHCMYLEGKKKLKKAEEVVVFIDSQRIDISSKNEDHVLVNFPLTQVKDVTLCLNDGQYSRTCVLVARENVISQYKAFVFYCKTDELAHEFYELVNLAFQLGFKLLERFHRQSSCSEPSRRMSRCKKAVKSMNGEYVRGRCEPDDDSDGSDDVFSAESAGCVLENENCFAERTVTVPVSDPAGSRKLGKRNASYIHAELKDCHRVEYQSDLGNWFTNSCRRIRRYFKKDSASDESTDSNDI